MRKVQVPGVLTLGLAFAATANAWLVNVDFSYPLSERMFDGQGAYPDPGNDVWTIVDPGMWPEYRTIDDDPLLYSDGTQSPLTVTWTGEHGTGANIHGLGTPDDSNLLFDFRFFSQSVATVPAPNGPSTSQKGLLLRGLRSPSHLLHELSLSAANKGERQGCLSQYGTA